MLWQGYRVILQVELQAHHVLCHLHIQNLKDLLSNMELVVLLKSRGGPAAILVVHRV